MDCRRTTPIDPPRDDAEAVMLDFVNPEWPGGRLRGASGEGLIQTQHAALMQTEFGFSKEELTCNPHVPLQGHLTPHFSDHGNVGMEVRSS